MTDSTDDAGSGQSGIRRGFVGGLIGTALMTVYRFPVFRALPPTSEFWARYVGRGPPEKYGKIGLLLHFAYGGFAGAVFGLVFGRSMRNVYPATVIASTYAIALAVFGEVVLLNRLLDEQVEDHERAVFYIAHLVYGLTLGTWMVSGQSVGDVYDS